MPMRSLEKFPFQGRSPVQISYISKKEEREKENSWNTESNTTF